MYLMVDSSGGCYPRHHTNPFSDEKCMGMKKENDHSYQHQTCEFHDSALLKAKVYSGWDIPLEPLCGREFDTQENYQWRKMFCNWGRGGWEYALGYGGQSLLHLGGSEGMLPQVNLDFYNCCAFRGHTVLRLFQVFLILSWGAEPPPPLDFDLGGAPLVLTSVYLLYQCLTNELFSDSLVTLGPEVWLHRATYTDTDLTKCKKVGISGVLISTFFNAEIACEFT